MKKKHFLLGLVCFGALVLGACSGNKTSSAAPASSGSGSSEPASSSSSTQHEHQYDEHGVCPTDGAYGGVTVAVDEHWNLGNVVANTPYFGRVELASGKQYLMNANGMVPINAEKTKAWFKTSTSWAEINLDSALQLNPASVDNYAYFHMEFTAPANDLQVWVEEYTPHTHTYDEYGLCENCPYGIFEGYRGTTYSSYPVSVAVPASENQYYECRFLHTDASVTFFETDVRQSSTLATVKLAVRKGGNWETLYSGPANNSALFNHLGNLGDNHFIYARFNWTFEGEPTTSLLRVSNLLVNHYFDATDEYRGEWIWDFGEGNEQEIFNDYVANMDTIKVVYFGHNEAFAGERYTPLTVGFGANPVISAYQVNPGTHQPEMLNMEADGSYIAKYDGGIGFELYYTGDQNIVGNDSFKVGLSVYNVVGLRLSDNDYLGDLVVVGENSTPANYTAGKIYYFRLDACAGHTYQLSNGGVVPSETKAYYIDTLGEVHEYDKGNTPFPASTYDNYLYLVHRPTADETNASIRVDYKTHAVNDYGYCTTHHEYIGYEIDTNDLIDLMDMADGEKEYRRFHATAGHQYQVEGFSTLTDEDFSFAVKKGNSFVPINIGSTFAPLDDYGDDGYVYITVQAHGAKDDPSFQIDEDHIYNAVGLCLADDTYIDDGETLEINQPCSDIDYAQGDTFYFRVEAYAGHTYKIFNSNWVPGETDRYYLDADGITHSYTLTDPFPENTYDNYIYLVYHPQVTGHGHFTLQVVDHPEDEHGLCPYGYRGADLILDQNAETFSMSSGDYKFFRIELSQLNTTWFGVNTGGTQYVRYTDVSFFILQNDAWVDITDDDTYYLGGNINYFEYEVPDTDDGYVYIEIHASKDYTNVSEFYLYNTDD